MTDLNLGLFLSARRDFEQAQYLILGALQQIRRTFSENRIYPYLGELIGLYESLHTIVGKLDMMREARPGELKGIDLEAQRLIYERSKGGWEQMDYVEDLIQWALPHIQQTIEEGRTIYEFVEEHLRMQEVGIVPTYREEGYLIVPDHEARATHILQYSLSIFVSANERFRRLKTVHVKRIDQGPLAVPPQQIKLDLMAEHRDLPNPATFYVDPEIDFPFEPTTLPIAKRMLMRRLYEA